MFVWCSNGILPTHTVHTASAEQYYQQCYYCITYYDANLLQHDSGQFCGQPFTKLALQQHQVSEETTTRGVEGMGLFDDEQRSGMCGAECMHVRVFKIRCEVLQNFNPIVCTTYTYTVYVRVCVVCVN